MLSFILFHLAKNPNVQKTLFEEINQRCKNNQMNESTFANMPYLKACIKESLRFVTDRFFKFVLVFLGGGECSVVTRPTREYFGYMET